MTHLKELGVINCVFALVFGGLLLFPQTGISYDTIEQVIMMVLTIINIRDDENVMELPRRMHMELFIEASDKRPIMTGKARLNVQDAIMAATICLELKP